MGHRVTIRNIDIPRERELRDEVKWICDSLGLVSGRDIDETSFRIMYELLDLFSDENLVSTEEVAKSLRIESPRVNHHLRNLMETGIVVREKRKVALRGGSLSSALTEMKKDSERIFDRMIEISRKIDEAFDL